MDARIINIHKLILTKMKAKIHDLNMAAKKKKADKILCGLMTKPPTNWVKNISQHNKRPCEPAHSQHYTQWCSCSFFSKIGKDTNAIPHHFI